jgi:hypothetical protein
MWPQQELAVGEKFTNQFESGSLLPGAPGELFAREAGHWGLERWARTSLIALTPEDGGPAWWDIGRGMASAVV